MKKVNLNPTDRVIRDSLKLSWQEFFNKKTSGMSDDIRVGMTKLWDSQFDVLYQKFVQELNFKTQPKKTTHDTTKYIFNGKEYGKGRLVLAIVEQLAKKHTYYELRKMLPDECGIPESPSALSKGYRILCNIQSKYGIFQTLNEARRRNTSKQHRYFFDNPIQTSDGITIVVTSQWAITNINKFIRRVKREVRGIKIKEIKTKNRK
jgi:hypothetical protein